MPEPHEHDAPLVSIALICYRHERFIARAIEGVLAQETDFPVELVIGDDCSDDATLAIIHESTQGHRFQIRVLPADSRLGMHQNVHRTVAACRGRYVAMLEGDDYWLTADKLSLQLRFMENRPDIALCFHPVEMREEPGQGFMGEQPVNARRLTTTTSEALTEENFIPTCSVMLRRRCWPDYDPRFAHLRLLDWVLWWKISLQGGIGCVDKVMGVYRLHAGGAWSTASNIARHHELRRMALLLAATCPPSFRPLWFHFAARRSRDLFYESMKKGEAVTALAHLARFAFDTLHRGPLSSLPWFKSMSLSAPSITNV